MSRAINSGTHKRLNFEQQRPGAVNSGGNGSPAQAFFMHRNQQFRRVVHLPKAGTGHLEHGQFRCGAESVLYASQQPVCASVVSLKLKDNIHDVLQNLWSCYESVLGDMTDKYNRHFSLLCKSKKTYGHFLNLTHRARRRIHRIGKHRLHRIHYHQIRPYFVGLPDNIINACLRINQTIRIFAPKSYCAHFYLRCTFFS